MKIACLILAHKNAQQLKRLCDVLSYNGLYVFIHIDRKWKLTEEDRSILASLKEKCHIIDTRISTFLDHRSLVDASLALVREARDKVNPTYYILMSAQDYPIKPIRDLKELLKSNYPKPYIDCTPYDNSNWVYHKFKWSTLCYYVENIKHHCKSVFLRRVINRIFWDIERLLIPTPLTTYNRLKKHGVQLYGGSAWWCLPDKAIDDILNDIDTHIKLFELYQKTYTPEETFFQTYIMRSSVANLVDINPPEARAQNSLTYANFETSTKKFAGHPHIITVDDWKWLNKRPEYIARKFDLSVDSAILDTIDSEILK